MPKRRFRSVRGRSRSRRPFSKRRKLRGWKRVAGRQAFTHKRVRKYLDTINQASTGGTAGSITLLNSCTQSTSQFSRIGQTIAMHSLQIHIEFDIVAVTPLNGQLVRYGVFYDRDPS